MYSQPVRIFILCLCASEVKTFPGIDWNKPWGVVSPLFLPFEINVRYVSERSHQVISI
ncbi:hypothetical protein SAMN02745866_00240 [Alteromonadaceae bacterium Bs31]|nr:hypothetical protein SAMN02745866_00240 [Alteromonadaceae bacterium Bs31]